MHLKPNENSTSTYYSDEMFKNFVDIRPSFLKEINLTTNGKDYFNYFESYLNTFFASLLSYKWISKIGTLNWNNMKKRVLEASPISLATTYNLYADPSMKVIENIFPIFILKIYLIFQINVENGD